MAVLVFLLLYLNIEERLFHRFISVKMTNFFLFYQVPTYYLIVLPIIYQAVVVSLGQFCPKVIK